MLFCKMNGLGNDYIFIDSLYTSKADIDHIKGSKVTIQKLSDRHFGVGGDGVVVLEDSNVADAKMHIYNADGTEATMCGNALRCIGKILFDRYNGQRTEFSVETLSGERQIKILNSTLNKALINTDMGCPSITKKLDDLEFIKAGNDHIVFYVDTLDSKTMDRAQHLSLKYDANVEAVQIIKNGLKMRVWERGSGETFACGTGATAVAYSAFNKGLVSNTTQVELRGGKLIANINEGNVSLIGEASLNYIGEIDLKHYGKN